MIQWVNDMTSLKDLKSTSYSTWMYTMFTYHRCGVALDIRWTSPCFGFYGATIMKGKITISSALKNAIFLIDTALWLLCFFGCVWVFCFVKIIPLQNSGDVAACAHHSANPWPAFEELRHVDSRSPGPVLSTRPNLPLSIHVFSISWLRVIVIRIHKVPSWWW